MRAAIFRGPGAVEVGDRPDPVIQATTDAIVRVVLACVCGSDLWYYRGESPHAVGSIGHEFIGVVEDIGGDDDTVTPGDLVVAPFIFSEMSCPHCLNGSTINCVQGGNFGNGTIDGGQGEAVRVPLAGATLVPVPGCGHRPPPPPAGRRAAALRSWWSRPPVVERAPGPGVRAPGRIPLLVAARRCPAVLADRRLPSVTPTSKIRKQGAEPDRTLKVRTEPVRN
jgi:hypothetical protein